MYLVTIHNLSRSLERFPHFCWNYYYQVLPGIIVIEQYRQE